MFEEAFAKQTQLGPNTQVLHARPHETFNADLPVPDPDLNRLRAATQNLKYMTPEDQDLISALLQGHARDRALGATGRDLMFGLQTALMPAEGLPRTLGDTSGIVNRFLKDAGFGSIAHKGGTVFGNSKGRPTHDVLNVLDLSILEPYFDYAARQRNLPRTGTE
jgi:hypothetical protein